MLITILLSSPLSNRAAVIRERRTPPITPLRTARVELKGACSGERCTDVFAAVCEARSAAEMMETVEREIAAAKNPMMTLQDWLSVGRHEGRRATTQRAKRETEKSSSRGRIASTCDRRPGARPTKETSHVVAQTCLWNANTPRRDIVAHFVSRITLRSIFRSVARVWTRASTHRSAIKIRERATTSE
jgi:hypothetical protein